MICQFALPSKSGADLKKLRLMNKTLAKFVTPYLFRWICLSRAAENFQAWKGVTEGDLGQYVEHVCIHSTTFIDEITMSEYCARLIQHMDKLRSVPEAAPMKIRYLGEIYRKENLDFDLQLGRTTLLPGDRKQLWDGYNEYLQHAKSQKETGCDDLYQALIMGLPSLPRVKGFSFPTEWPVNVPPMKKMKSLGSEGMHIEWEGGSFIFPGPIARKHSPLRLPPQCTRSWTAKDGLSVRTYDFLAVLRAVSHFSMDRRILLHPDLSGGGHNLSRALQSGSSSCPVGLPFEAFSAIEQLQNHSTIRELVAATSNPFRSLQRLELTISNPLPDAREFTPFYGGPRRAGYLLLSVPNLESLILRQARRESDDTDIGTLKEIFRVQEELVAFTFPLPAHIRSQYPPITFEYRIQPEGTNLSGTLRVMNGPLYPKLKHLELDCFISSAGTLISLVERVCTTLEDFDSPKH